MRRKPCLWIGLAAIVLMNGVTHARGLQLSLDAVVSSMRGGVFNSQFKAFFNEGFGATGDALYDFGIVSAGVSTGFYRLSGDDRRDNHANLTFMPLYALLRVQPRIESENIGIHFEAGLGTAFLRSELSGVDLPEPQKDFEAAFSVIGGVGFSQRISDAWAVKLGFKVQNVWPSEEVNRDGALQLLLLTAGLRWRTH